MDDRHELSIDFVIKELLDNSKPYSPQILHQFSDISYEDLEQIKSRWKDIDFERKVNLLQDLKSLMETDTLISCDDFGLFVLDDDNPGIKSHAIQLLEECSDTKLAAIYINLTRKSPVTLVNISAAAALGKFVLLGELEEIPSQLALRVLRTLIEIYQESKNDQLRRKTLESLGYSSDNQVDQIILEAINNIEKSWQLSAIIAISRSANEKWGKVILEKLHDEDPDIIIEAVKAAGELELVAAKDAIIEFLRDSSDNNELHLQSIWALSKIGGNEVRDIFDDLITTSEDEEETDMLEMALENLELTNGMPLLDLNEQE